MAEICIRKCKKYVVGLVFPSVHPEILHYYTVNLEVLSYRERCRGNPGPLLQTAELSHQIASEPQHLMEMEWWLVQIIYHLK